jgi:hypothetical protein
MREPVMNLYLLVSTAFLLSFLSLPRYDGVEIHT